MDVGFVGLGAMGQGTAEPVQFTWTSDDGGQSGTMTAVVGGRTFSGPFFQIRQDVRREVLDPLWLGWPAGWRDWRYWGPVPTQEFTTIYAGKILANRSAPDGIRMRCRFRLMDLPAGMAGGGQASVTSATTGSSARPSPGDDAFAPSLPARDRRRLRLMGARHLDGMGARGADE